MDPVEERRSNASDLESQASSSTSSSGTERELPWANNMTLTKTASSKWQKPEASSRPDLEPGAEYCLTKTLTPARDPNTHDPAIWPDNLVDWDSPEDPQNARNWSLRKKILVTAQLGMTTMGAAFASTSFTPASTSLQEEFGCSSTVATLCLSLYILGFAFGPLLFAPISELYGRKVSFVPQYFVFGVFLIGVATAENIQTVVLCRFFAGLMASAPISNTAGCLADMFDDKIRGYAVCLYSVAVIGGPTIGPLIGAAITTSYLGWRWTEYITSMLIFFIFALDVFFLPETFGPTILQRKASKLRHSTGNWALHAKIDEKELTLKEILQKNLLRPLHMLTTEPIILLLATYNAFVYGLLYLLFEAFPIAFEEGRGWSPVLSSLMFVAVLFGVLISACLQISYQPLFWKQLAKAKAAGKPNNPEARLPPMLLGGTLFTAGLFLFGWTAAPRYYAALPIIGAVLIGAGFVLIFQNCVNYLIDAFTVYAASAQAANNFFRALAGAGFPLFASPMFHNLGVNWATTILGIFAGILVPIPILFFIFGPRIRERSAYTNGGQKEKH